MSTYDMSNCSPHQSSHTLTVIYLDSCYVISQLEYSSWIIILGYY